MFKVKGKTASATALIMLLLVVPVFAVNVQGGEWKYGAVHKPGDWGAFSSYYHGSRPHWAGVSSLDRKGNSSVVHAKKAETAYAFINTNIGERVNFDFDFDD